MTEIRILLFARLRELAGSDSVTVEAAFTNNSRGIERRNFDKSCGACRLVASMRDCGRWRVR